MIPPWRPRPRSLVTSLTLWFAAVTSLLMIATTLMIYASMRSHLIAGDRSIVGDKLEEYRELLINGPTEKPLAQEVAEEADGDSWMEAYVRIVDGTGRSLMETPDFPDDITWPPTTDSGPAIALADSAEEGPCSVGSLAVTLASGESRRVDVVLVNPKTTEILSQHRTIAIIALLASLVVAGLCGRLFARRATAAITSLGRTVGAIRPDHLGERIALDHLPNEVAILGGQFNTMLDRLAEAFSRLDRFSADIAHELRTPVNNLRIVSEVALSKHRADDPDSEALLSVLEESQRLGRLINQLLLLARVENPHRQLMTETIDLVHELQVVATYYEVAATDRGITLTCACEPAALRSDRALFQRMLGNLIENAIAHTPRGGTIAVTAQVRGDRIIIRVRDSGEGIASAVLPHVFDRFRRGGSDFSGRVGLGLPIVRSIAGVHGGTVELSSQPGQGTTAELSLPIAATPA